MILLIASIGEFEKEMSFMAITFEISGCVVSRRRLSIVILWFSLPPSATSILNRANRLLDGSNGDGENIPSLISHRSAIIEDIRNIAEELITNGFDPSKVRNADCLVLL